MSEATPKRSNIVVRKFNGFDSGFGWVVWDKDTTLYMSLFGKWYPFVSHDGAYICLFASEKYAKEALEKFYPAPKLHLSDLKLGQKFRTIGVSVIVDNQKYMKVEPTDNRKFGILNLETYIVTPIDSDWEVELID